MKRNAWVLVCLIFLVDSSYAWGNTSVLFTRDPWLMQIGFVLLAVNFFIILMMFQFGVKMIRMRHHAMVDEPDHWSHTLLTSLQRYNVIE